MVTKENDALLVEDVDNIENEYTDAQELAAELEHDNEQVPPLLQLRVTPELVPHGNAQIRLKYIKLYVFL